MLTGAGGGADGARADLADWGMLQPVRVMRRGLRLRHLKEKIRSTRGNTKGEVAAGTAKQALLGGSIIHQYSVLDLPLGLERSKASTATERSQEQKSMASRKIGRCFLEKYHDELFPLQQQPLAQKFCAEELQMKCLMLQLCCRITDGERKPIPRGNGH